MSTLSDYVLLRVAESYDLSTIETLHQVPVSLFKHLATAARQLANHAFFSTQHVRQLLLQYQASICRRIYRTYAIAAS